jgi:hypothetical protein
MQPHWHWHWQAVTDQAPRRRADLEPANSPPEPGLALALAAGSGLGLGLGSLSVHCQWALAGALPGGSSTVSTVAGPALPAPTGRLHAPPVAVTVAF